MIVFGLIVGICWLGVGILCIRERKKADSDMLWNATFLAIFFLIFGVIGILGFVLSSVSLGITCILLSVGLLCVGAAVFIIRQKLCCNTVIDAKYIRYNRYSGGKGQYSYAPVFEYSFDSVTYQRQTPNGYGSLKKLQRRYQQGLIYPIYIDSANPKNCVDRKTISIGDVLLLILGVLILVLYAAMVVC